MKLTEFLNKKVVSIFEGTECGKVDNPIFENFLLLGFEIKKDDLTFFVFAKDIFCVSKNFVMIKTKNCLALAKTFSGTTFLKKQVIDTNGKCLGKILNAFLSKNFGIKKFVLHRHTFSPKQILGNDDFVVIKKTHFAKDNQKKLQKNEKSMLKVSILPKK